MAGQSRREQRRAKGKSSSLLDGLEDDFLDIEENFKAPSPASEILKAEVKTQAETSSKVVASTKVEPIPLPVSPIIEPVTSNEAQAKPIVAAKVETKIITPTQAMVEPTTIKTGSKPVANWEQTSSRPDEKLVANHQQSNSKVVAAKDTEKRPKGETGSKVVAQPVAEVVANWEQTSSKLVAKSSFSELSGLQRNLLIVIYQSCKYQGQKISQQLSVEYLAQSTKTTIGTVKNAIHRLVDKGILIKDKFKNGRGGWTQYRLQDGAYNELAFLESSSKLIANYKQSGSKVVAQLVAQPVAGLPSSSSYLDINKTTTIYKADASENSPIKWKMEIPKILRDNGFNEGHIDQLARDAKFGIREVEESMAAFAFDLGFDDVKRQIRRPVAMFLALLKRGEPYISQKGYISEEDRMIQENIERLKNARDEKKKRKEELLNLKFDEWVASKSRQEITQMVAPFTTYMDIFHKQALKDYFVENELKSREGEMQ